jgi:tetratricopeptide (TPR) repeat protein
MNQPPPLTGIGRLLACLAALGGSPLLVAQSPPAAPPAPAPAAAAARPGPPELARAAAAAAESGKWESAVQLYGEWLDADPLNPLARASYGAALYRTGHFAEARRELERAVMMEPKLAGSWATLGLLYERDEEPWLALSAHARAVHLEPRNARHRVAFALALAKRGWSDAAEMELREAVTLDPALPDAHFNLAVLAVRRSPPAVESARRHYREARRLGADPDGEIESFLHEAEKKN